MKNPNLVRTLYFSVIHDGRPKDKEAWYREMEGGGDGEEREGGVNKARDKTIMERKVIHIFVKSQLVGYQHLGSNLLTLHCTGIMFSVYEL